MSKEFKWGSWAAICDVCGERWRSDELQRRWDGQMVCRFDMEPRHEQDFIKIPHPEQGVKWTRRDADQPINTPTPLIADIPIGAGSYVAIP